MTATWKTLVKVGIFGVVMLLLTGALFAIFGSTDRGRTTAIPPSSPTHRA